MNLVPFMEQWNMFPKSGGSIICAVSGGRDSICLLHYLKTLSEDRDFTVIAAHLNHMMRTTAKRDQEFVQNFCREYEIPFYVEYGDVYGMAKKWNCSVEESGRRLRYEFLERLSEETGSEKIATAHHMGDQAETVLLNLIRGTGSDGLAGIPPVRGKFIRPLLHTSREEIEAYLASFSMSHMEDETNTNLDFARNRLRLVIWPELKTLNSNLQENIVRASDLVRKENAYLNRLAEACLPAEGTQTEVKQLLQQDEVIRARMIRILLGRLPSGKKDVGTVHIEQLMKLAKDGGVLTLPGNMEAVCRNGMFSVGMRKEPLPVQELLEGENRWGSYLITLKQGEEGDFVVAANDAPVYVRPWDSHDRMESSTSRGLRSLKRLWADYRIPEEERQRIPVISTAGTIIGVYRIGQNQQYQTPETGEKIGITIKKEEDR